MVVSGREAAAARAESGPSASGTQEENHTFFFFSFIHSPDHSCCETIPTCFLPATRKVQNIPCIFFSDSSTVQRCILTSLGFLSFPPSISFSALTVSPNYLPQIFFYPFYDPWKILPTHLSLRMDWIRMDPSYLSTVWENLLEELSCCQTS